MRYLALPFLLCLPVFAQDPNTLLLQTFAHDPSGWVAQGDGAELHTISDAERVRPGRSALELTYNIVPQHFSGMLLGAPETVARTQRLRFWARSDHDTAFAVLLTERKPGGGNYAAWFWAPANVWQPIELTPADFTPSDGPNDPVDADGKLDIDQVNGIAIFDLAQFFAQMKPNPDVPMQLAAASGHHSLLIENFELSASAPTPPIAPAGAVPIDLPGRDFLQWVTPGVMNLKPSPQGSPLGPHALQASYRQTNGELEVLVRRVANPNLAHAKRLVFDVASENEATLMIAIEMTNPKGGQGPRYTMPIYPPGGKEVFHVDLKLDSFDGPPGHFDPARWRTIAILDVTASGGGAEGRNTLWIGNLQAVN
ncbi:MAG TPA: hypothetical protein VML19_09695 [Verrucomicrobiae bacterium]|nr:hypothetical protein [Verrucomicrobiae bacterium]